MNQSVRFILAVLLMVAVVVITNLVFSPVPRGGRTAAPDTTAAQPTAPPAQEPSPSETAAPPPAAPMPAQAADTIVVESPLYRFAFSTQGAALISAEMLQFKSFTRDGPVQLAGRSPGGLISHDLLSANNQEIDLGNVSFTPSARHLSVSENSGPQVLRFTHSSAQYGTTTTGA